MKRCWLKILNERISLEEKKKHDYFREFDLNKVLKKGNGPIITQKKEESPKENISKEEAEKRELISLFISIEI